MAKLVGKTTFWSDSSFRFQNNRRDTLLHRDKMALTNVTDQNFQVDTATYRILDAAINRAGEGLRVVEDYTRMVMSDAHLSQNLKQLRHDITSVTNSFDRGKRIGARDSQSDVGRNNQTQSEYQRENETGIIQANMSRVAQSLRTIEEFSKTLNVDVASKVEQLRYDVYTLEKAILTTMMSVKNLVGARLYVLVNGMGSLEEFKATCKSLLNAGVDMLQLRDKRLRDRELVVAGKVLTEITRGTYAKWVMNDRCDLALAAGADGVHLGQDDLKVGDARRVVGPSKLIGVSTHSLEQARQAVIDGANYIGVGPVFPSQTKSFKNHVGVELVEQVAAEIKLPFYPIGGINLENIEALTAIGCHYAAVSKAIIKAEDPVDAALEMKASLTRNAPV